MKKVGLSITALVFFLFCCFVMMPYFSARHVIPQQIENLDSADVYIRWAAAWNLGEWTLGNPFARKWTLQGLSKLRQMAESDPSQSVRLIAQDALAKIQKH